MYVVLANVGHGAAVSNMLQDSDRERRAQALARRPHREESRCREARDLVCTQETIAEVAHGILLLPQVRMAEDGAIFQAQIDMSKRVRQPRFYAEAFPRTTDVILIKSRFRDADLVSPSGHCLHQLVVHSAEGSNSLVHVLVN